MAINNEGFYYDLRGDKKKALQLYNMSLALSREINDSLATAQTLNNMAALNEDLGNIPEAIRMYKESLLLRKKFNDQSGIAQSLNNLGYLYEKMGNYSTALEYHQKSYGIRLSIHDNAGMGGSLINIGRIYDNYIEDRKSAIAYYRKSLPLAIMSNDKKLQAIALDNIGVAFRKIAQTEVPRLLTKSKDAAFDSALYYFRLSYYIRKKENDERGIAYTLNNLGEIKQIQENMDSARWFFEKSLQIRRKLNDKKDIAFSLTNLATTYFKQANYTQARVLADEAYQLSNQTGFPENIKRIAFLMHELALIKKDYKTSLERYKTFILMRDSIQNQENKKTLIQKQYQFEYESKVRSDSLLRAEENKVIHAQFKQERTQRYALWGGLVSVIFIAGLLWNRFRVTQKQKDIIEMKEAETQKQKVLIELKNSELLSSIEYAKRIQATILPSQKELSQHLPDSFVLYLPKDIVAGDFYWMGVPTDAVSLDYLLIGAFDSTGHGVPGALVSIVCSKALEKSFHEYKLHQPAGILDKVSELVTTDFEKNNSEGDEVKDGMDASIVRLDLSKKTNHYERSIRWAGANNSLIYIFPDGTLHELKADKQPVGKTEIVKKFTQQDLTLPVGTMIFLYTDGYADQFGGKEGKKLTKKAFRELLKQCAFKSCEEQKAFLSGFYEEYKGKEEQIDDICIIGIRL